MRCTRKNFINNCIQFDLSKFSISDYERFIEKELVLEEPSRGNVIVKLPDMFGGIQLNDGNYLIKDGNNSITVYPKEVFERLYEVFI